MNKKVVMASALVLALAVSPFAGMSLGVSAEEGETAAVMSVSENGEGTGIMAVSGNEAEKTPLAAPTDLGWGPNYEIQFKGTNESLAENEYTNNAYAYWKVEVYKDGEYYTGMTLGDTYNYGDWEDKSGVRKEHVTRFSDRVDESGSYKFRVRSLAASDDEAYGDSDWSEWSEERIYVRPERELGTTVAYWDPETIGAFNYETVGNAAGYHIIVRKLDSDFWSFAMPVVDSESPRDMAGLQKAQSFAYDISSRGGSGRYYIEIRALSNNVDEIANGTWGPKSDILDTTVNAEKLGGILDSAADKSAAEAKELLTGSVHISAIQMAMQTDNSFRGQMKSLEEKYAAEQGITVKAPEVSAQAQKYVDPGRVQVVGAGLNVAGGSEVGLQMDLVQEADKVSVHDSYTKNVQLDISLAGGSQEIHELAVPVTVTMPVPQGLGAEKLVILHRHADGTMQRTGFRVNSDGTITFTLTSFSTFVFAEEGKGDNGSGENPGTPDNNPGINPGTQGGNTSQSGSGGPGYGDFLKNQIAAALPGSVVKVTKEQNMDTLSNSIMQQLVKRGDVALDMEYTYEGVDYHILIPAGMAVDNDIPWYGPLYLAAYFSFNENNVASPASLYIVQKGDTLSRIARTKNTTVARLAALNPQIKNTNHIVTGQIIQIQ